MHAALVNQAKQGDREAFDALARLTGDRSTTPATPATTVDEVVDALMA